MNVQLTSEHEEPENSAVTGSFTNNLDNKTEPVIVQSDSSAATSSLEEHELLVNTELAGDHMSQAWLQQHLDILRAEAEKKKKQKVQIMVVIASLAAFFLILSIFTKGSFHFYFYNFFGVFAGLTAMSKNQKKAISAISEIDDKRAVGPMCSLINLNSKTGERVIVEAFMIRMLPKLISSDAHLISSDQLNSLHDYIKSQGNKQNERCVLAILEALKQIGGSTSVPVVNALISGKGTGRKSAAIRAAATECLPYLLQNVDKNDTARTLLRGSSAASSGADMLVRPASEAKMDHAEEQLLRAAPEHPI